jgi:hypothetical protein
MSAETGSRRWFLKAIAASTSALALELGSKALPVPPARASILLPADAVRQGLPQAAPVAWVEKACVRIAHSSGTGLSPSFKSAMENQQLIVDTPQFKKYVYSDPQGGIVLVEFSNGRYDIAEYYGTGGNCPPK